MSISTHRRTSASGDASVPSVTIPAAIVTDSPFPFGADGSVPVCVGHDRHPATVSGAAEVAG